MFKKNTFGIEKLSVFFPAYNEAENLPETIHQASKVLEDLDLKDYEIIIINDASKDNTGEVAQKLAGEDKRVRVVTHKINLGYGGALKTGFRESKFPWVAFADSDGQFDFAEITGLLEKSQNADLVLGYRLNRADPFFRKIFTFGWKTLAWLILGLPGRDYSCGFKLIKKKVFDDVQPLVSEEKVTQIEMLVKAKRKKFRFAEIGVHHYPRRFGNPTGGSLFSKVFLKSIVDLFVLSWKLK